MALPWSGQISLAQIGEELQTGNLSLRNLSSLAGKSTPDAISEFYAYTSGGGGGEPKYEIMYSAVFLIDPCKWDIIDILYDHSTGMFYWTRDGKTFKEFAGEDVWFFQYEDREKGIFFWEVHYFNGKVEEVKGWVESYCGPY